MPLAKKILAFWAASQDRTSGQGRTASRNKDALGFWPGQDRLI